MHLPSKTSQAYMCQHSCSSLTLASSHQAAVVLHWHLLLCRHPRVLALPHMGSATDEVYERFAHILCENITRVREGRELLHRLC